LERVGIMHTMWKGAISFGLVNIPIKLYAATEDKDIKMRYLHKECHNPIKYEKKCPVCNEEVKPEEIIKGYEYEPGKFVEIEKSELDKLTSEANKAIEIIDFVDLKEIDPIFFNRSYYVGPNENGEKPFTLLKQAMENTGKIGLAKITIRSKQHLAVVRVYKNGLVLETIYFPDEVRNIDQVPNIPENVNIDEKEIKMAEQLIEQLTTEFEPSKYTDDYRNQLMNLIQSKITGEEVTVVKDKPKANVVDLMDALQASLDQSKTPQKAPVNKETKTDKPGVKKKSITKKKKATS
jgi:DNA end-binding protein Ku